MKKILILLLALSMVFSMTACGQKEAEDSAAEGITAIPLGGNLGEYELEGECFGTYTEIDFPKGIDLSGISESHLYYSEGKNTPYIAVYRWANEDGKTLEEETAALSEAFGAADYQMTTWEELAGDEGFYTIGYTDEEGNYYYVECDLMLDGDEFVEIDFYNATEEIALGDTGLYVAVPSGYTDLMNDEEKEHGTAFYGSYDDSYYLPSFWAGPYPNSYEELCWYLSETYEEMPLDEAAYDKIVASGWDKASCDEYYDALGITDVELFQGESNGYNIDVYAGNCSNGCCDDIYIDLKDGTYYNIFLYSEFIDPYPLYAKVIVDSLHTK